jgi:hypothetical protein
MDKRTSNILLVGIAVLAVVLLMSGMWLVFRGMNTAAEPAAPLPTATAIAALPTATTAVQEALPTATSLPTLVVLLPSATPPPTVTPTDTPAATDTPVPTDTPPPTNTPVPVVIPPTNTPVPPTNTPVPTPSGPQAVSINGLSSSRFNLQPRAQIQVNGKIWFEFTVDNSTGGNVAFSQLGVMPRKNGADRLDWYQNSWGGNNDSIKPGGLRWEDHISLPEAGSYTLRLVICFDSRDACRGGSGTWHTLSPEIPVNLP